MITVNCTHCNHQKNITQVAAGALPPTGGDYEWQESEHTFNCSKCKKTFEVRLRATLDGQVISCTALPKKVKQTEEKRVGDIPQPNL
jgi:transcription elongation factor Elf1